MIGEARAPLEEERDFLLRSIRDLDAEHAAGDMADGDYARLRDDYTARAARVLRALDGEEVELPAGPAGPGRAGPERAGPDSPAAPERAGVERAGVESPAGRPEAPVRVEVATTAGSPRPGGRRPPRRRRARAIVASVVVLLVGVGAGLAVAFSAGERAPGQSATGSIPSGATEDRVTKAQQLVGEGKILDAVKLYDDILRDDPQNPVALAQRGWLVSRVDPSLVDTGLASIDKAIAVDPGYAEAHFFKGMILWQAKADPAGGADEFQKAIDAGAPPDLATYLVQERDQARAQANGQPPPSTTTVP